METKNLANYSIDKVETRAGSIMLCKKKHSEALQSLFFNNQKLSKSQYVAEVNHAFIQECFMYCGLLSVGAFKDFLNELAYALRHVGDDRDKCYIGYIEFLMFVIDDLHYIPSLVHYTDWDEFEKREEV